MHKNLIYAICGAIFLILISCNDDKYLSQKTLHDYAKKAKLIQPNTASNSPFDALKYNKVITYDFDGDMEHSG